MNVIPFPKRRCRRVSTFITQGIRRPHSEPYFGGICLDGDWPVISIPAELLDLTDEYYFEKQMSPEELAACGILEELGMTLDELRNQ
jgi:hypothetical protein